MHRSTERLIETGLTSLLCAATLFGAAHAAPVADAAQRGDTRAVVALLGQHADVNAAQGDGMTALHWAATNNEATLVRLLLDAGADANAKTRIGSHTPLMLAAKNGNAGVIEPIVTGGADVNAMTTNGTTPLMFAAASGDVDTVKALIEHGAKLDAREFRRGLTAAMFAAAANRAPVITVLARAGAPLDATTTVIDLRTLDRAAFAGVLFGNPRPVPAGAGRDAARDPNRSASPKHDRIAGVDRDYPPNELVWAQGGMTALLLAAREGFVDTARALLDAGADVNQPSAADGTTPLLIATINGRFDLAMELLARGANPNQTARNGAAPLYATINEEWAPKSVPGLVHPQPRAHLNQKTTYLELMRALLDKGADPNARLKMRIWYSGNSVAGVDEVGATPFWRAAYASDVAALKLLVAAGADPNIATIKGPPRERIDDTVQADVPDLSRLPPVPIGGPGVPPIVAAAGVGYGEGFAGNTHHYAAGGMLAAVKYLVEQLHADVNATDYEGNTALHNAAARGDVAMIEYLASHGADVKAVNRKGQTTADMANGPVQRIQPWPEALALLEKLGAKNQHHCVSC